jgi:hypothetical protein
VLWSAVATAAIGCALLFLWPQGYFPEDMLVGLLITGSVAVVGYTILLIAGQAAPAILQLRDGFYKAAGRATGTVVNTSHQIPFDQDSLDED